MSPYTEKISDRIDGFDSYKVLFANDFLDIASYETARRTLNRMVNERKIKCVTDDSYYNPRYSGLIGECEAASIHELTPAIARKYNWSIAPCNSTTLNLLGLSTQVPTHYKYMSSGRYKEYEIGDIILEFRKVDPGEIANMSLKTATIIQAIKSLGKENITNEAIQEIRENLNERERRDLMNESKSVPLWIYGMIREISEGKNEQALYRRRRRPKSSSNQYCKKEEYI